MEWTDERIADLKRYWLEGLSASQVARKLGGGVTRNAVIGRVHRMGLSGRDAPSRPRSLGGRPPNSLIKARASAGGALRMATPRPPRPVTPSTPQFDVRPSATIHTLCAHTCRWPIGDPGEDDFGYCGRRKAAVGSYCEPHAAMAGRRPVVAAKVA